MIKRIELPSQERLHELFDYNHETGVFTWKLSPSRCTSAGSVAGSLHHTGYLNISIKRRRYQLHRLAWKYFYGEEPPAELDHINRDRTDNRISNLRPATKAQNCQNTSGLGVSFHKSSGKWIARIGLEYKNISIGSYDCPLMAGIDYLAMKSVLHPRSTS